MYVQLGFSGDPLDERFPSVALRNAPAGQMTQKGDVLFPRIDVDQWKKGREAKLSGKDGAQVPDAKIPSEHEDEISIDLFKSVELRVAEVIGVEEIPKAKKLYALYLDLGYEKRKIVSGIKEFFTPQDLIGKRIIVVANLKPATLCGVESRGMLLAAGPKDKSALGLLTVDESAPLGSRVS